MYTLGGKIMGSIRVRKGVVDDFDKSLRQVQTIEHFGSTRESTRGGHGVECLQSFFKR